MRASSIRLCRSRSGQLLGIFFVGGAEDVVGCGEGGEVGRRVGGGGGRVRWRGGIGGGGATVLKAHGKTAVITATTVELGVDGGEIAGADGFVSIYMCKGVIEMTYRPGPMLGSRAAERTPMMRHRPRRRVVRFMVV